MNDRLLFKKDTLNNQLTLFSQKSKDPFVVFSLVIPFGSMHSHKSTHFGIAHFLEHMIFQSGKNKIRSLKEFIELNGGSFNGTTYDSYTEFNFSIKKSLFLKTLEEFVESIFYPYFKEKDIFLQKNIITNERKQREKFYPGRDELYKYIYNDLINAEYIPLRQLFGSKSDLEDIDKNLLEKIHSVYYFSNISCFVAGNFDLKSTKHILAKIPLKNKIKKTKDVFVKASIQKKKYHTKKFKSVNNEIYFRVGFFNNPNIAKETEIWFFGNALTNYAHGPLYQWLRKERGWVYSVYFNSWANKKNVYWIFKIPFNNKKHLNSFRKNFNDKILETFLKEDFIKKELNRVKNKMALKYQTIESRVDTAKYFYTKYGKIYSEKDLIKILNTIATSKKFLHFINNTLKQKNSTEFVTSGY